MKKYFLGLVALVLAIGLSSFNVLSKWSTSPFNYVAPALNPYSQINVQNVSNWTSGSITCTGTVDKACVIVVDDRNLDQNSDLDPAKVTISAADADANGSFLVSSLTLSFSTGSSITNKQ